MNKIYLFLLTLIVGLSASARLVYFDNNWGDSNFSETPWCHTYHDTNGTSYAWTNSLETMTAIGDNGYVFKVKETNESGNAYTPDKVMFHVGETKTGSFTLTDGRAYYYSAPHDIAKWVIRAEVSKDNWSNLAEFEYKYDNTYETGAIDVDWSFLQWGLNLYVTNSNTRGWLTPTSTNLSSFTSSTAMTVSNGGSAGTTGSIKGTYNFKLDLNNLSNITLTVIPAKIEMTDPIVKLNGTQVSWTSTGTNTYTYTASLKRTDVVTFFDGNDGAQWGPNSSGDTWYVNPNSGDGALKDVALAKRVKGFEVNDADNTSYNPAGTYTFTLDIADPANPKVTISVDAGTVISKLPDPLYFAYNPGTGDNWVFGNQTGTRVGNVETFTFSSNEATSYFIFGVSGYGWLTENGKACLYGSGTANLEVGDTNGTTPYLVTNNPQVWKLTDGPAEYEVKLDYSTGHVTVKRTRTVTVPSGYYFYGDMNRWSCLSNAGQTITSNYIDVDPAEVWGDGASSEKFLSKEELAEWEFVSSEAPEGATNTTDQWYVLDFTNLTDDAGNTGRLCGQFKITRGVTSAAVTNEDDNNWGTDNFADSKDYLIDNQIKTGTEYSAKRGSGLGNFQLDCSYLTGAKIYFQPATNAIIITGTQNYIYAYYSKANSTDFSAPKTATFNVPSQLRYFVNYHGWSEPNNADYNPGGIYNWEEVDPSTIADLRNNYGISEVYTKFYRKLIPLGASHRFPVELNCTVSRSDETTFPYQRVLCDNLFFLESEPVNVYFRYEDGHLPEWVRFNTYIESYDSETGVVSGRSWFTGAQSSWAAMEIKVIDGVTWFKSITEVSGNFVNGSHALFNTSEGASYPRGGLFASDADRAKAYINGANLYYVVPSGTEDLQLLYSHLKGTYQLGTDHADNHGFQINAELFDSNGDLDTSYNGVTYKFTVTPLSGANVGKTITGTQGTDGESNAPFYDIANTELSAGYYQVEVSATKGSKTYTATDIYPVFPAYATTTAAAEDAAAPLATDDTVTLYFKGDWEGTIYVYVYVYDDSGDLINNKAWPGIAMTDIETGTGYYSYTVPSNLVNGRAIFNTNGGSRYPGDDETGLAINGKSHLFNAADNSWSEYTGTDTDVELDTHTEYSIPNLSDLLNEFYLENFDVSQVRGSDNQMHDKVLTIEAHSHVALNYSWVKYENTAKDNEEGIDSNNTNSHTCLNSDNAYYRAYNYAATKPSAKYQTQTANTLAGNAPSPSGSGARAARSRAVGGNSTGVEEVISDNVTDTDDAGAPVVYYNLQGIRVDNPSDGIFIRVQGKSASKVLVR